MRSRPSGRQGLQSGAGDRRLRLLSAAGGATGTVRSISVVGHEPVPAGRPTEKDTGVTLRPTFAFNRAALRSDLETSECGANAIPEIIAML